MAKFESRALAAGNESKKLPQKAVLTPRPRKLLERSDLRLRRLTAKKPARGSKK